MQRFEYKGRLLRTTSTRAEVYKLVVIDLNKYHPELFLGLLKDSSVLDLWNKAVKDTDMQQADKEARHHFWYDGRVLLPLSDYEHLLDKIYVEKKAVEEKRYSQLDQDTVDEKDKHKTLRRVRRVRRVRRRRLMMMSHQ